jgi:hypothetical protein
MHRSLPAPRRRRVWYRWVAVAAGLGGIVTLVLLAIAPSPGFVSSGSPGSPDSSTVDDSGTKGPGLTAVHSMPPPTADPSTGPAGRGSGGRPSGSAPDDAALSAGRSGSSGAGGSSGSGGSTGSTGGTDAGQPTAPAGPSLTVEAEASTVLRSGSAAVTADPTTSGGAYVSGIGYWEDGVAGALVFTGVDLPIAGTWQLTIYFLDPGPKGPRHATVAVSGTDPHTLQFSGPPTCCATRILDLSLDAGTHTITISNPTDVGPSIDRVVLTWIGPPQDTD